MSLKTNSKCAQCRRAGEKLMLKGEKCLGPKCPMSKRSYPPGMHGPNQKHAKISNYGKQLREKQKVKRRELNIALTRRFVKVLMTKFEILQNDK